MNWNPFNKAKSQHSEGPSTPHGGPQSASREPNPDAAERFAEAAQGVAREVFEVELDFSVDSLEILDDMIDEIASEGASADERKSLLMAFGCYLGEVIVRHAPGKWVVTDEPLLIEYPSHPFVVELEKSGIYDKLECNPISKVIKRFEEGDEHHLPSFYAAMIKFKLPDRPSKRSRP